MQLTPVKYITDAQKLVSKSYIENIVPTITRTILKKKREVVHYREG